MNHQVPANPPHTSTRMTDPSHHSKTRGPQNPRKSKSRSSQSAAKTKNECRAEKTKTKNRGKTKPKRNTHVEKKLHRCGGTKNPTRSPTNTSREQVSAGPTKPKISHKSDTSPPQKNDHMTEYRRKAPAVQTPVTKCFTIQESTQRPQISTTKAPSHSASTRMNPPKKFNANALYRGQSLDSDLGVTHKAPHIRRRISPDFPQNVPIRESVRSSPKTHDTRRAAFEVTRMHRGESTDSQMSCMSALFSSSKSRAGMRDTTHEMPPLDLTDEMPQSDDTIEHKAASMSQSECTSYKTPQSDSADSIRHVLCSQSKFAVAVDGVTPFDTPADRGMPSPSQPPPTPVSDERRNSRTVTKRLGAEVSGECETKSKSSPKTGAVASLVAKFTAAAAELRPIKRSGRRASCSSIGAHRTAARKRLARLGEFFSFFFTARTHFFSPRV